MRLFSGFLMCVLLLPFTLWGQAVGTTGTGLASYFSNEFHGSTTKYGEVYNRNDLVAAHKTYPYNSRVRVTNLDNNQQVTVRVVDQGPFIQGRIIEVSYRAAELLGMLESKTARVHVELLSNGDAATARAGNGPSTRPADQTPQVTPPPPPTPGVLAPPSNISPAPPPAVERPAVEAPAAAPIPAQRVVPAPAPGAINDRASSPQEAAATAKESKGKKEAVTYAPVQNKLFTKGQFGAGLYKVEIREPGSGTHGVQIFSLSTLESAMQEIAKLQGKWFDNILLHCVETDGKMSYKIILGPHESQTVASSYAKQLLKKHKMKGFVVTL